MFCRFCGKKIKMASVFCEYCGKKQRKKVNEHFLEFILNRNTHHLKKEKILNYENYLRIYCHISLFFVIIYTIIFLGYLSQLNFWGTVLNGYVSGSFFYIRMNLLGARFGQIGKDTIFYLLTVMVLFVILCINSYLNLLAHNEYMLNFWSLILFASSFLFTFKIFLIIRKNLNFKITE